MHLGVVIITVSKYHWVKGVFGSLEKNLQSNGFTAPLNYKQIFFNGTKEDLPLW